MVALGIADDVTQQETSEVFLWDGRPLQRSRIHGHIGEADVLRTADRSFEKQNIKLDVTIGLRKTLKFNLFFFLTFNTCICRHITH